jgi:tRNA A-37 threonylcarbamoyl transferase component Bud32
MIDSYSIFQPITLYQFFPKNKRLKLNKQGIEYIKLNNEPKNPLRSDSFFNNSKNRFSSNQNNRTLSTNRTNHNSFNSINQQYINNYQTNNNFFKYQNKHFNKNHQNKYNTIIMDNHILDRYISLNSNLLPKYFDFNKKIKNIAPLDYKNFNSNLPNLYVKKQNKTKEKINMKAFTTLYSNNNINHNNDIYQNNILNSISQSKNIFNQEKKENNKNDKNFNPILNSIEDKINKYLIGRELGKGAYANVRLVIDKLTKQKYAMKIYDKSKLNDNAKKKCVYREVEIMQRVEHKNIVLLNEVIQTSKQILIIMEYIKGISLREYYNKEIKYQKNISPNKLILLKKIFKQIFSAMNYLHKNHIAHRDIKLENILLTKDEEIKIIDFGFGMYNPEERLQNFFCGTPNYMAPEISMKQSYVGQYADMWSLGILFYKMLCADFPFKGENEKALFKQVRKCEYNIPDYVDDNARKIIKSLINLDPKKRPSCETILHSIWFDNIK